MKLCASSQFVVCSLVLAAGSCFHGGTGSKRESGLPEPPSVANPKGQAGRGEASDVVVDRPVSTGTGELSATHEGPYGSSQPHLERRFVVLVRGRVAGDASISLEARDDGLMAHGTRSALLSPRERGVVRHFEEEVVSRDGLFVSCESRLEVEGETRLLHARAVPGAVEVRYDDGPVRRLEAGDGKMVWAHDAALLDLALRGRSGDVRLVFDGATGSLGPVVLVERLSGGWVLMEELGVLTRTRWEGGDPLPREIALPNLHLEYVPWGHEWSDAEEASGEEAAGAVLRGCLVVGAEVILDPPEAFPGLECRDGRGRFSASGAVCEARDVPLSGLLPEVGPEARRLVDAMPEGLSQRARAVWLIGEIESRLSRPPRGPGLWEATPEQALAAGSGDCNEAAAVFMAAAPLAGIEARRRAGLVGDDCSAVGERPLRPHAWVEVWLDGAWVRADPSRGELPAGGSYVDLGDGSALSARLRAMSAAARGATITVVPQSL